MTRRAIGGIAAVCVMLLAGCGGDGSSDGDDALQRQADLQAIGELQKSFHKALSTKDIDLMMTLWAPTASLTQGPGTTVVGTDDIRQAWLGTKPFQPTTRWISVSPSYKTRATVNGDKATLVFECYFIDIPTKTVGPVTGADMQLGRIEGRWLITNMVGGSATLRV